MSPYKAWIGNCWGFSACKLRYRKEKKLTIYVNNQHAYENSEGNY